MEEQSYEIKFEYKPVTESMNKMLLSNGIKEIPTVYIGDYRLELELVELSPEMKEKARIELGETPDVTSDAIQRLRQLLKDEKELKAPVDSDFWLTMFLRARKFNVERAFRLIKNYYKCKITYADIFKNLKPTNEVNIFKQDILILQHERDQHGRRILIVDFGSRWKPNEVTLDEIFKGVVLLSELASKEPQTQVCGCVAVIDLEGLSFSQAMKFTPLFFQRLLEWLQTGTPLTIVNVHVVNQPGIFRILYNLIKLFLREDLRDRLILHGNNRQSLHQYIDPECLSENYGGTIKLPTHFDESAYSKLLLVCDPEFDAINSYGYTPDEVNDQ